MTQHCTALIIGHVTHDRFGEEVMAGGSVLYAARTFRALGARVLIATVVGEDFLHDEIFSEFECVVGRAGQTTTFTNMYDEHGMRTQWLDATAPGVRPDDLPGSWRADIVFIAPVMCEVDLLMWNHLLDAPLVGVGVQGFLRTVERDNGGEKSPNSPRIAALVGSSSEGTRVDWGARVVPRRWELRRGELASVDIAFAGKEDLVEQPDLLDDLREAVPTVSLTLGRAGAILFNGDGSHRIRAYPTREVDPTGAGDTFAAAYLFATARNQHPIDAARFACAAASFVVEEQGPTRFGTFEQVTQRARSVVTE